MKMGQTSRRNGVQDILCPFTNLYITQGSGYADGSYSHKGTRAIDVVNGDGSRAPYYAPFDCKAVMVLPDYGEALWQSLEKVRFADGTIDYCTFVTVHDNTINYVVGYIAKQGEQIGNMGDQGNATGIHCHIEFSKGINNMIQNQYGVWGVNNAVEFEEACFMDDTNILSGVANWKYLKDVQVDTIESLREEKEKYKELYEKEMLKSKDLQAQLDLSNSKINKAIKELSK